MWEYMGILWDPMGICQDSVLNPIYQISIVNIPVVRAGPSHNGAPGEVSFRRAPMKQVLFA